jgi:hypothetical protein
MVANSGARPLLGSSSSVTGWPKHSQDHCIENVQFLNCIKVDHPGTNFDEFWNYKI